jgi:PIN domain nuclease of toxin-antitoxin system
LIADSDVHVSSVSIWELRLKWQKLDRHGRRKGTLDPDHALAYVVRSPIILAPLSGQDCAAFLPEPLAHNDPFDEMLLIHAQQLGAKLLTRDRLLLGHPLVYPL